MAAAFANPDYVEAVLHSYRHRLRLAAGAPECKDLECRLAALPEINRPTVTLDGMADGNFAASDGTAFARRFVGPHVHHQVPEPGHNLPQEAPQAFADAVLEAARLGVRDRTG
jgi:pimeloyl-ACP methyl ester carboxylesterase